MTPETRHRDLARADDSLVVLVDVQERLWSHIAGHEALGKRIGIVLEAARRLEVPVLATEQYPKGLGPTIPALAGAETLEKHTFSCFGDADFAQRVQEHGRGQLVVVGIEAHVCVLQTTLDAIAWGHAVHVPFDAVGSRDPEHRDRALDRQAAAGAQVTSVESLLFEWMHSCRHEAFRDLQGLLK